MDNPETSPRIRRTLVMAALYSLLWAVSCDVLLELSVWTGSVDHWYGFFRFSLRFGFWFGLGSGLVWVVLLLLIGLTGRLWLSFAILLDICLVLVAANQAKLGVRDEPLYPSDSDFVREPKFLSTMVSPTQVGLLVLGLIVITVGLLWVGRLASRSFPRVRRSDSPRAWTRLLVLRVVVVVVAGLLLVSASNFNQPGNGWRAMYESRGTHWKFWYQRLNYQENGFVGGVLYNTHTVAMATPAGYSQATMKQIADKYAAEAATLNRHRDPAALDDVNVVIVLSEAFSDPTRLKGIKVAEDPMPRTRALMRTTISGYMLAQLYGGGTANMEFETLTGQSLALFEPQLNSPYQQLVTDYPSYPSAVGYLEQHGHRAIAIHPYITTMYKREQVYPTFGFEEFVHDSTMQETDRIDDSDFISDQSAFDEVRHQIDTNADPLLVNLVTMQNHVPMADSYDDPIPVEGLSGHDQDNAENYARGVEHTDEALAGFLSSLEKSDEKTVVVFYGDHLPGIYPTDVEQDNGVRRMRETPMFIWSSFQQNRHVALPTTSPTQFLPKVFDLIGAPLPPYYALLRALYTEIPAMEQGNFINAANEEVSEDELSPRAKELLADFRLVQYDFSIGKRYAVDQMFYPMQESSSASESP